MVSVGDKVQVVTDISGRRSVIPSAEGTELSVWQPANMEADFGERSGHASVALSDGSIIVIGGFTASSIAKNDVWKSTDGGVTWTQVKGQTAGQIVTVELTGGGSYYATTITAATVVGVGGSGGTLTCTVVDGVMTGVSLNIEGFGYTDGTYPVSTSYQTTHGTATGMSKNAGGTGYSVGDVLTLYGSGVGGATARVATLSGSAVATVTLLTGGYGYGVTYYSTTVSPSGGVGCKINVTSITQTIPATVTITTESPSSWTPRGYFGCVAMPDNSLVIMGGMNTSSTSTNLNDVWRSTDGGATWTEQTASASWVARRLFACCTLPASTPAPNGTIVVIGGFTTSEVGDVWASTDYGANWTQMTAAAECDPRQMMSAVVMPNGDIIIIGGVKTSVKNDVWKSADGGATWSRIATFPKYRCLYGFAVSSSGVISLTGGFDNNGDSLNDEWESADGITWTQKKLNDTNGFAARYYHQMVRTPAGRLIVTAGYDNDGTQYGDVWYRT